MRELDDLRKEIDEIDEEILSLYERRMETARQVGELKKESGMKVYDPIREKELMDRKMSSLPDPALKRGARRLFELLMQCSRQQQYAVGAMPDPVKKAGFDGYLSKVSASRNPVANPLVLYQGQPGAYGEEAAVRFFGEDARRSNRKDFEEVFQSLHEGIGDYGVVPIENNSTGSIGSVYDLLGKYGCFIVGEQVVPVDHCLMAPKGADLSTITDVYSHEQGFQQSEPFLKGHGDWNRRMMANTAESARFVKDCGDVTKAAIASRRAADLYGLEILAESINFNTENHTRFAVVSKVMELREGSNKISTMFTVSHESGSLHRMIAIFAMRGMNLLKIESRPIIGKTWEYLFFADLSGNLKSEGMESLIFELIEESHSFEVLGNYIGAGGGE
ncbi:MAG TPA: prephenate dehydratase domain-containing protein [Clostridiaceae bacterium]|nr:prephenate dehydratase domain-containing protein [Clostridiaceae bacterium]